MTEGIQTFAYYRQTYKLSKAVSIRFFVHNRICPIYKISFPIIIIPETMFLLLPTNVHIYKWVFLKFILGIYNAHAHAF